MRPVAYILNNYDLDRVSGEVARQEKPAHHLFGIDALRAGGWQVEIVPQLAGPRWLTWVGESLRRLRFPLPLGDLGQQWAAWRAAPRGAVLYAPCQTQMCTLARLRACGIVRTPLVAIAHHPPVHGRLAWLRRVFFRWETRGTDRFPALSNGVARDVRSHSGRIGTASDHYSSILNWGPDLDYYTRFAAAGPGAGVIATGRTGRDWLTFGRGATQANTATRLFCPTSDVRPEFAEFGPNVQVHAQRDESELPYPKLLPVLAGARAIAVPLAIGPALSGLTSITDALGLGKPLLVTRHPLLDIDIENEGIGRWVAPGDERGWAEALRWVDSHPDEAVAMGRRARALAERTWNSRIFSAQIVALLEQARSGSA